MKNANKPAYPLEKTPHAVEGRIGLTKRERFSMEAMQGLLAWDGFYGNESLEEKAKQSVACADALLKELGENNE